AGFDVMNLAANHVLDAGVTGMDHTRHALEAEGLVTAGVGHTQGEARRLATLEKHGITFGFLGYCEDTNYSLGTRGPCHAYYELESVLEDVAKHRDAVDVLVVSIHADIEFMPTPSVSRLRNFREIARAGADIVLGHHPHVPQGCEMVDGRLIAYSLGNFIFPAHTSPYMKGNAPHTAHSFLLLARVSNDGVHSFERVPFEIGEPPDERPAPLEGDARDEMLGHLARLDAHLKDEAFVRRTWREVAKRHLMIYIKRAAERDVENVIEEFVGRLCLTAENRNWMEECLAMGREAWERRNAETPDPLHRPHYRFTAGPPQSGTGSPEDASEEPDTPGPEKGAAGA
ncbi:MAG TPA: CapA family protein, partial [Planctomycetota bacterium]|nr:CapA family protein [Planctomycetota bacterium]